MERFIESLLEIQEDQLLDFCRKHALHGNPKIFDGAESKYYEFRKRIAERLEVNFSEVLIVGSAKLGFSPFKKKAFDLESDVDVSIVSAQLYERIMGYILDYQLELRSDRKSVSQNEIDRYHKFLEYGAMGWIRPDLLPSSFRVEKLKEDWFDFFDSISNGKSEVGNYKVSCGVFKSYMHLEKYTLSGYRTLKKNLEIRNIR
jgi:hypothetical protein